MTEDPVKLYVIVMAILLCVLSFVAYDSYKQAHAFEMALDRAPAEATQMQQLASDVKALVDMLAQSELRAGHKVLIERVEKNMNLKHSKLDEDSTPIGRGIKGKERRFVWAFGGGRSSPPLNRQQVARFCEAVERDSRGILKTIEVKLSRATGEGMPEAGKEEKVTGDMYSGQVVFGLRVVEQ